MDTNDKIALFVKAYESSASAKDAALVAGLDPVHSWALARSLGLPAKPRSLLNRGRGMAPSPATIAGIAALRAIAEEHNLPTRSVANRVASHFNNIAARKKKAEDVAKAAADTAPAGK